MPAFSYRAANQDGVLHDGALEAASRSSALELLREANLTPVGLWEGPAARASGRGLGATLAGFLKNRRSRVGPQHILMLTRSLGALLKADLNVDRALHISGLLAAGPETRLLAHSLLKQVRSGEPLSAGWAATGQALPPYFVSMVEAGELGGTLPETLTQLAGLMQRQLEVRRRIVSALVYPSMLAGVVLVTLVLLLAFVLPRFEALFSESEAALPWSTSVVLGAGRFFADYLAWIASGTAAMLVLAMRWLRTPRGRTRWHRWLLHSRLLGGLPGALDSARLLRTMSTLSRSGLPLPAAMRVAGGTLVNRCLFEAHEEATRDVQAGETLSAALARTKVFPAVAVQLARVGEESGRLEDMLVSAAEVLEFDGQERLERLLTLMVPVLTIVMGLMVAALIGSVLVGLLSINDLAF